MNSSNIMPKSQHSARSQAGPSTSVGGAAKERISAIHERTTRKEDEDLALKRKLVPKLAKRAYHLEEGNTWRQDWVQYQKNTHPLFGICLHHPFHPIRLPQRIIILVGSIGKQITRVYDIMLLANCMSLWLILTFLCALVATLCDQHSVSP